MHHHSAFAPISPREPIKPTNHQATKPSPLRHHQYILCTPATTPQPTSSHLLLSCSPNLRLTPLFLSLHHERHRDGIGSAAPPSSSQSASQFPFLLSIPHMQPHPVPSGRRTRALPSPSPPHPSSIISILLFPALFSIFLFVCSLCVCIQCMCACVAV